MDDYPKIGRIFVPSVLLARESDGTRGRGWAKRRREWCNSKATRSEPKARTAWRSGDSTPTPPVRAPGRAAWVEPFNEETLLGPVRTVLANDRL